MSDFNNHVTVNWGAVSLSSSSGTKVTLPCSYTNTTYSACIVQINTDNGSQRTSYISARAKASITFKGYYAGTLTGCWIAVGY